MSGILEHNEQEEIEGAQVDDKEDGSMQPRNEPASSEYSDRASYRGDLSDGMRQGERILIEENGDFFVGNWENDEKSGFAVTISSKASVKVNMDSGLDVSQLRIEPASREYSDYACYRGDFKDGARQGEGIQIQQNGDFSVGNWDEDKKSGFVVTRSSEAPLMMNIDPERDGQDSEAQ